MMRWASMVMARSCRRFGVTLIVLMPVAILKRFETDYPDQWMDANAGCAFEAVQIVADAVVRANSPASPDIHSALKMTDMTPILMYSGKIKFDATGQNMNNAVTILQGQRGRARVIAPRSIADAGLQYPLPPFEARCRASLRNNNLHPGIDMTPILMYSGKIKFDATGQNMNNAVTILQGQRGRARVIAPRSIADAGLQYPLPPFEAR